MTKVFISAGDYSGDIHAAKLMEELKQLIPDIAFEGIGGSRMEEQGLKSIIPIEDISVVGFIEVAKKYPLFKRLLNDSKSKIKNGQYDVLITVDYPGFNLRLAEYAKSIGIKTCQYIAPQTWAWGKGRSAKMSNYIDLLLVVFPFEVEYFRQYAINTKFVGHPLLDDPAFSSELLEIEKREHKIAFLPGSRIQEIKRHSELFIRVAEQMKADDNSLEIALAVTKNIKSEVYEEYYPSSIFTYYSDARTLMRSSKAGVVKAGTSTLEAALCGMPFVMIYKTSAFTYYYGKSVINLPYLSLVNILEDNDVVTELVQKQASAKNVKKELINLIEDKDSYTKQFYTFENIRNNLGSKGASLTAALNIKELIENKIQI